MILWANWERSPQAPTRAAASHVEEITQQKNKKVMDWGQKISHPLFFECKLVEGVDCNFHGNKCWRHMFCFWFKTQIPSFTMLCERDKKLSLGSCRNMYVRCDGGHWIQMKARISKTYSSSRYCCRQIQCLLMYSLALGFVDFLWVSSRAS